MGLFSFIKEAGEKLFGGKPAQAATAAAPSAQDLNAQAAQAITTYIQAQNLGLEDLQVTFDGSEGKVTVRGVAPRPSGQRKSHPVLRQRCQRAKCGQPDDGHPARARSPVPRRGAR